ncbi:MAG: hypothetical protein A2Z98_10570 [Spirochaetes bacterium GWB1_27_13]|nr:MAG: hypothetical protein A2Z98_10570 [Spirochaetes bacterium GWB1_27_13]
MGDRYLIEELEREIGGRFRLVEIENLYNYNLSYTIDKDENIIGLVIKNRKLKKISETISKMKYLEELDLSDNQLTNLPESIGNLTNLQQLDLQNNQLRNLPESIGKLTNLQQLDLYNNQLSNLPESIGNLTNLQEFSLFANQLRNLPESIGKLTNLKQLSLYNNQLRNLPESIGNLTNLPELDLSENRLTNLPKSIGNLTNLQELFFFANQLNNLPETIGNLTNLKKIYLNNNQLRNLPESIEKLNNLKGLYLYGNLLSELPENIKQLINLEYLDLRNNNLSIPKRILEKKENPLKIINYYFNYIIKHLARDRYLINELEKEIGGLLEELELVEIENLYNYPISYAIDKDGNIIGLVIRNRKLRKFSETISKMKYLQQLDLSNNQLNNLPENIEKLTNLQQLDLSNNQLNNLSKSIENLTNLEVLFLSNNQLNNLPENIEKLTNLQQLDLSNNQLSNLPKSIGNLTNLKELCLYNNQLSNLPENIGNLTNLQKLDLFDNQLSNLPESIKQLTNLEYLDLRNNAFSIPDEILEKYRDPFEILNYCFTYENYEKKKINEVKVLLVGDGGAGKTSVINRLIYDKYNPEENKTDGIKIDKWTININNENTRLNVWDFGGQEMYHSTHQFFLTKRSVYILVHDSRSEDTKGRIEYWLKLITSYGEDSPIIVVLNKIDQHHFDVNESFLKNKYKQIKHIVRVSCKTNQCVNILRDYIDDVVKNIPHINEQWIKDWFDVKEILENTQKDYISYDEYLNICNTKKIYEISCKTLIGFLHDLGVVLNYQDDNRLKDMNILNPEWVTKAVYNIQNDNVLFQNRGILDINELNRILDSKIYPDNKHYFIVDMMKKFELCFALDGTNETQFLIPRLLQVEESFVVNKWDYKNSLNFQYHYDFLPDSVISRFIVRINNFVKDKTYWQTGVVLAYQGSEALVKADIVDKKIYIYITGIVADRRTFLHIIRSHFDHIHKTISRIKAEEKIGVYGFDKVIDFNHLVKLESLGEKTYIPEGFSEPINIKDILDGVETERDTQTLFEKLEEYRDKEYNLSKKTENLLQLIRNSDNKDYKEHEKQYRETGKELENIKLEITTIETKLKNRGIDDTKMRPDITRFAKAKILQREEELKRLQELKDEKPKVEKELNDRQKRKNSIDKESKSKFWVILWIPVIFSLLLYFIFFVIYIIFGWNATEPLTFFIPFIPSMMLSYIYLAITGKEFSIKKIYKNRVNSNKSNLYIKYGFNKAEYDELTLKLEEIDGKIANLEKN